MAIRGSLREASLPDVVQLLAMGQKTGCLAVTDRARLGYIYFDRGAVCHASVVNRRDRLGDLLVGHGLIDAATLAAALEAQDARSGKRLGEILVERGAVPREQVEKLLRLQIEEAVYLLFTWTHGIFHFEPDQRPEAGALRVSLDAEGLLLEGARRVDEWALVEKKIPSLDLVFAVAAPRESLQSADLSPEQRRILPLMDGRRSVREIAEATGLVEFEVGKAVFGLVQAGFVHPQGRKEPPRSEGASPARQQECFNLGVAFLRTGMLEDAARELQRVLQMAPDNQAARFYMGLLELRSGRPRAAARWLMELIRQGGRWGSAFHNLAVALERMDRPHDALLAAEKALGLLPGAVEVQLLYGVLLARVGRMAEAAEWLARYRRNLGERSRPPSVFYAQAVLVAGSCGRLDEAARLAEEGVHAYPHVAAVVLHAGAVRERQGSLQEAEMLYRRAVECDPSLPQAHKALGEVLLARGMHAEALESFERAAALAPDLGADLLCKLGNLNYKRGDRASAVRLWHDALSIDPGNTMARTNLDLVGAVLAQAE